MLLKNVFKPIKTVVSLLFISCLGTNLTHAQLLQCEQNHTKDHQQLCRKDLKQLRDQFNDHQLTAYLVTDAPLRLLDDTHQFWLHRTLQCKNLDCLKQQFEFRIEDLNFYTSMNQTLTQHYLKYENGQISKQPIHIKIHQLTKDRIKIEGLAYRNPNNRLESQAVAMLAYTTPEKKNEITDNENNCKYQLKFQKALLTIKTQQNGCERFTGIYRLYD